MLWKKVKVRLRSWAVWAALLALIAFVAKEWIGVEIPGWDRFIELMMALLAAFGIVNNPDNRGEF